MGLCLLCNKARGQQCLETYLVAGYWEFCYCLLMLTFAQVTNKNA